jgi:mono/diheme cytochrome c family protein
LASSLVLVGAMAADRAPAEVVPAPTSLQPFLKAHCFECHDSDTAKGNLDLTTASFDLADRRAQARWVTVHDRVARGEMPPTKKERPQAAAQQAFLAALAKPLIAADDQREANEGRATLRRLNRLEYEDTVRDLLGVSWLQIKGILPEDGEAHRFIKSGEALDISHVQMAQYLAAADYALRAALGTSVEPPQRTTVRHYARAQGYLTRKMFFNEFNRAGERATFPILDFSGQPEVRAGKQPVTVGDKDPELREREAIGVAAGAYEPIEPKFSEFKAPHSGRYTLRLNAFSVWVGPSKEPVDKNKPEKGVRWWKPDLDTITKGRRSEPVTVSSELPGRQLRWLTTVDVGTEPTVHEFTVDLLQGETIRVDAARLFRSRPPGTWRNPLAQEDGQPGVAFRWLEVDGPHAPDTAGRTLLAGDLPLTQGTAGVEITPRDAAADARRLLATFMTTAYRRAPTTAEIDRFAGVVARALADGNTFTDALLTGYAGVLCSPGFVSVEERPGTLDDLALATRLALFLWNTTPDAELRTLAAQKKLGDPAVLRAQTERLLSDGRARRFTDAFTDYWLDLRKLDHTSPDAELYPDYYLDDLLTESAANETRLFVAEMIRADLPARTVVRSDFTFLNERLALHYGLPPVDGVAMRKVALPPDSVRGGLMTQAAVLKVTANGTTTSPVLRGTWIMERILGMPPPPPPPSVPAVEPDTRGAKTIREQLAKHREVESCNACHRLIDPTGFALEQFDILGGQRERYRAVDHDAKDKPKSPPGFGKNGQPFIFHLAQPVDCSGELWDGRRFADVRELKALLLTDERLIARNVLRQLLTWGTGAAERFGDRARVEAILDEAAKQQYGVRTLIHGLVQSTLFRHK